MFQIILSVASLALMIFALIDVITSENWQIQHLPKVFWILLIIVLPLIGSVIWLIVGKDRGIAGGTATNRGTASDHGTAIDRGTAIDHGSFGSPQRLDPRPEPALDDDAAIEQEIAYHEKQAEIRRLEAELRNRRGDKPS
ncbi:MAG: PLDc N-terminal domain-containing protein [Pseudolysinimonas sp.]